MLSALFSATKTRQQQGKHVKASLALALSGPETIISHLKQAAFPLFEQHDLQWIFHSVVAVVLCRLSKDGAKQGWH